MTRYDIRLRRKQMTKGQIEGFKDFNSLNQMVSREQKSNSIRKFILIITALLLVISMIVFGVMRVTEKKEVKEDENVDQYIFDEFK